MWSPVLLTLAVNLPSVSRTPMRWCTFSCQYLLRIFRYSKRLLGNNQGPASRYSSKSLKLHLVTLTLSISIPLASCLVFDNHTLHLILKSCAKWKKPTEFTLHRAAQWMAFSPFWVFVFVKPANICTISKRGKRLEIIELLSPSSNGNDIKTKVERSSILASFLISKRNKPAYSRTCKDQSEANPVYSIP